jgi:hypothetical protein
MRISSLAASLGVATAVLLGGATGASATTTSAPSLATQATYNSGDGFGDGFGGFGRDGFGRDGFGFGGFGRDGFGRDGFGRYSFYDYSRESHDFRGFRDSRDSRDFRHHDGRFFDHKRR